MANCSISLIFAAAFFIISSRNINGFSLPTLKLLSGHEMPVVGIDCIGFTKDVAENWTTNALKIGHRFFDGAYDYDNEKEIGSAIKKWIAEGNRREDVFITSKMPVQGLRPQDISLFLNITLKDLDLGYVDMYLLHFPAGSKRTDTLEEAYNADGTIILDATTDIIAIWKEMENQVKAGKAKSIGFSNFNKTQLMRIWGNSEIKPSNLQMENNAYLPQTELVEYAQSLGIVVSGYSPTDSVGNFGTGIDNQTVLIPELVSHPDVKGLAAKYQKTAIQILGRYNRQRNLIVNTDDYDEKDLKDMLEILHFTLSEEEMKLLKSLDQCGKYRKFSKLAKRGIEKHPEYPWPEFAKEQLSLGSHN